MSRCASCIFAISSEFSGDVAVTSALRAGSAVISPDAASFAAGAVGDRGVETASAVGSGSTGVIGGVSLASFARRASRFFSSVRRNTLIVVRNDL